MHGDQLVDRMVDELAMGRKGLSFRCHRLRADWMVSDPAYALGQAILATVRYVLHPATPQLARLATNLDRCFVTAPDCDSGPAERSAYLPEQWPLHGSAKPRCADILEVHLDLHNSGDDLRRARPHHVLHRPSTDHSLAAMA